MMDAVGQNRCMDCKFMHQVKNSQIIGSVLSMCLCGPPTVQMVQTPQGPALVSNYPLVGVDSLSCGQFKPYEALLDS